MGFSRIRMTLAASTKSIFAWLGKYKVPISLFLVSRIMIALTVIGATAYGIEQGGTLIRWDAQSYLDIAENGYQIETWYEGGSRLSAFFPFYPVLINGFRTLTGLTFVQAGISLSIVFSFLATLLLYEYARRWRGESVANMAAALFCFYPASVFLVSVYTEGLFLCLVLATLFLLETGKEKRSMILVGLACVTRVTGSILGLVFAYEIWRKSKNALKLALYSICAIIPFGFLLTMHYAKYGSPFVFFQAQSIVWNQHAVWPWEGLILVYSKAISEVWAYPMWRTDAFVLTIVLLTLALSFKKVPRPVWLFGLGIVLLTLSSDRILGMSRYMMLVLPLYFYWASFLHTRQWIANIVLMISAGWMIWSTVLFALSKSIF